MPRIEPPTPYSLRQRLGPQSSDETDAVNDRQQQTPTAEEERRRRERRARAEQHVAAERERELEGPIVHEDEDGNPHVDVRA